MKEQTPISVLGIDPGARSLGWAGVTRLGGKWIVESSGSNTAEAESLEAAAWEQFEWWASEPRIPQGVSIVAIEGYEYQGKRTAGPQAIWTPMVIGWLIRDAAERVEVRTVVVPRTVSFAHFRIAKSTDITRTSNRPEVRRALHAIFGESAELLRNEHERSAAMVAVAGEARGRGLLAERWIRGRGKR